MNISGNGIAHILLFFDHPKGAFTIDWRLIKEGKRGAEILIFVAVSLAPDLKLLKKT